MKESYLQNYLIRALNLIPQTFAVNYSSNRETGAGFPDVICCHEGKFYGIEVKYGTRQAVMQRKWELRIEEAQGQYVLINTLEQAMSFVQDMME